VAAAGGSLLDLNYHHCIFSFSSGRYTFWLLLLVMDKDYQQAGFPTLTQIFNHAQLSRITFIWIISTAVTFDDSFVWYCADFWINIGLF